MRNAIACLINQRTFLKQLNIISTDNIIGDTGATSLSEALKSNATLIELDLNCEDKRKKTYKMTSINKSLISLSLRVNRQPH